MRKLLVFPYSGTAIEALDCLGDEWKCVGFVSDDPSIVGRTQFGIRVYNRSVFGEMSDALVLAVNGSPTSFLTRPDVIVNLGLDRSRFATVIHPRAFVSAHASIGKNVLLMAGVVVSATASVGWHVIMLPNSVLHHNSSISEYTLVGGNVTVAGNTSIGRNCYLGASSTFRNGIIVGDRTLVGMGSNVVSSIGGGNVVVGNPAREISSIVASRLRAQL